MVINITANKNCKDNTQKTNVVMACEYTQKMKMKNYAHIDWME